MTMMVRHLTIWFILLYAIAIKETKADTDPNVTGRKFENQMSQLSLYRKVFKQKRLEQMMAVENILKMENYEQQYKIINIIFEKIFKVIEDAKIQVSESGYLPGEEFPTQQQHKEAIGNIVENTAFFGDIVLRLPDIAHKIIQHYKNWELLALWSISFTNGTTIYDEMDSKLIHLMAQELKLIPRDPNYYNPFTKVHKHSKNKVQEKQNQDPLAKNKKKKKARGPRLSHVDL